MPATRNEAAKKSGSVASKVAADVATHLRSAAAYQRNVVVLPSYDRRAGKAFRTDLDWPGYFARARQLTSMSTTKPCCSLARKDSPGRR